MMKREVAAKFEETFGGLMGQYLSYQALQLLPSHLRFMYVAHNRVLTTDTYNRTQHLIAGDLWNTPAVYVQSLRRSPFGKTIVAGTQTMMERIFGRPISEGEVRVAHELSERQEQHFPESMWQFVLDNGGRMPIDIWAVPEGEVILPHEPLFVVKGPSELAAHLEPLLIPSFYPCAVATHSFLHTEQGNIPFALQDPRNVPDPYVGILVNQAANVGGVKNTSSDAAAVAIEGITSWGTSSGSWDS
jgi:nicotinic acid phosphoribosyltransferase